MKLTIVLAATVLTGVFATGAVAADKPDAFVATVAQANMSEIELSKLALQKSQDARVRAFAQHVIDDQTKTETLLAVVAKQEHLPLPDALDEVHAAKVADLTARTTDFDRAYVDTMVSDHAAAVELFNGYANTGEELYLKRFAQNTLPTLIAHKAAVEALRSGM